MEIISIIIAVSSAVLSVITYIKTYQYEKRKETIKMFNILQNEVLDNFVCIKNNNAKLIIENLDNEECKKAYNDYRILIARLEQFSAGVREKIFDFKTVDKIAGSHFIYLYLKVKPIIDEANKNETKIVNYCQFIELVKKLNKKHKILEVL